MKVASLFVILAIVSALIVGCKSSNEYQPAVKTSTSLEQAAQTIDKASTQVDDALYALDAVTKTPGDMGKAFSKYSDAVSRLESTSIDVSSKVVAMREKRDAYFAQWDKDVATIKNEDVRNRSEQRKTEIKSQFDKVHADYEKLQKALAPFMSDLRDIRTALSFNMTAGGVAAVQGTAKKAHSDAGPVHQSLDALSGDFRQLGVAVATTMPSTMPHAAQ